MKTNYLPYFIALLSLSILLNLFLYIDTKEQLTLINKMKKESNGITFVWNDDEESIPVDGSPILLEYTDEDTVYIGPLETETNSAEYQFTITDDSISVYDFDRYVGTVKIEGQLKQLIDKDNK